MTTNRLKVIMALAFISALAIPGFALGTGTLTISGTMPLLETISASPASYTLDLVNGVTGVTVATVTETCNRKTGYTVSISDSNNGSLSKSGASEGVPYTLSYGGGSYFTPSTTGAIVSTATGKTEKAGTANSLKITIPPPTALFDDGTFTDTLTFTITAQ